MTEATDIEFSTVQAIFTTEDAKAHAAEVHGLLSGLICAGYRFESTDFIKIVDDMFNNGESFSSKVKTAIRLMFSDVCYKILDDSYGFQLLLPDDDDSIAERSNALGVWVQGFNLGFGLQQKKQSALSEDVKEVITDFGEIANLSTEMDEDEESEQAYFEIAEYVRISAILCFSELGKPPEADEKPATLH